MAWNESNGGNKPRDPWGGGNQGPPDLDEALKKLQSQLGSFFGSRSSGGGNKASNSLLIFGFFAVVFVWALSGFYQVDEQERAVVLRFGKYFDTVQPGLQWNPPLIY